MISTNWKLATALGVVGAIAFSVASADARTQRNLWNARAQVSGTVDGGPYAYQSPTFRDSYNAYSQSTGYFGTGTFSDGRRVPGTNFNPNQ